MEIIVAGDNTLYDTAQGILLVVVRGTDDVMKKVKLPIVLVPSLKRNLFPPCPYVKKMSKQLLKKMGHLSILARLMFS